MATLEEFKTKDYLQCSHCHHLTAYLEKEELTLNDGDHEVSIFRCWKKCEWCLFYEYNLYRKRYPLQNFELPTQPTTVQMPTQPTMVRIQPTMVRMPKQRTMVRMPKQPTMAQVPEQPTTAEQQTIAKQPTTAKQPTAAKQPTNAKQTTKEDCQSLSPGYVRPSKCWKSMIQRCLQMRAAFTMLEGLFPTHQMEMEKHFKPLRQECLELHYSTLKSFIKAKIGHTHLDQLLRVRIPSWSPEFCALLKQCMEIHKWKEPKVDDSNLPFLLRKWVTWKTHTWATSHGINPHGHTLFVLHNYLCEFRNHENDASLVPMVYCEANVRDKNRTLFC